MSALPDGIPSTSGVGKEKKLIALWVGYDGRLLLPTLAIAHPLRSGASDQAINPRRSDYPRRTSYLSPLYLLLPVSLFTFTFTFLLLRSPSLRDIGPIGEAGDRLARRKEFGKTTGGLAAHGLTPRAAD
ncbi:hypothetical protein BDK51DRAFT_47857 [Blyttiomyces helicus]|uniref:Uncharacterized protein n=1 Tax=Blyttiomyces helicus TaxID=388810 RepID=A0A4P9W056_9FUNG|nr:hypothetical protein BDK51DRAFT_47857 [Blyttiomyces helicus]|eukprot:RKO85012.1 hypothetical protein BDK51DRAFT_47857 [Blyttiomyces helicus]